jgi:hypothetical protein
MGETMRIAVAALVALAVLSAPTPARAAVPSEISVQGVLRDDMGKLQNMMVAVTVTLYDAPMAGNKLAGPFGPTMVMATNGLFTLTIRDANLTSELSASSGVWMEVVAGNDAFPRQKLSPDVFALMCGTADVANSMPGVTDSNGNIGIGVTSPLSTLHIDGANASFRIGSNKAGNGYSFDNDNVDGYKLKLRYKNPINVYREVMTFDYSTGVGIGTTTPDNQLHVAGYTHLNGGLTLDRSVGGSPVAYLIQYADADIVHFQQGNNIVATIDVNGGYHAVSDARLKTNVRPIGHALDDVERLRGVRFNWKSNGDPSIGVVAQEVEEVYPELVSNTADSKAVDYEKLSAVLIEATKELRRENRAMRARIERLEQR